ncbi:hypothetical protein [Nocardia sp. 348MFTsu5.1]|uniref:hypothetical protein n=1 Tax=Nocardia sp. 348MFTsu5.1 TaxID=1172185 RepID=UPI000399DBD7|nr:hypothetical protein [Nocardia sp. 348MFTsu5.1]
MSSHAGGVSFGGAHAQVAGASASGAVYFYQVWFLFAACVIVTMVITAVTIAQQTFQKTRP